MSALKNCKSIAQRNNAAMTGEGKEKIVRGVLLLVRALIFCMVLWLPLSAQCAELSNLRWSSGPAKIRLVVDLDEPVKYTQSVQDKQIVLKIAAKTAKKLQPKIKDSVLKSAILEPDGNDARLVLNLAKSAQHRVFVLKAPHRLVVDVYRILITQTHKDLGGGLVYSFRQDELQGLPLRAHILTLAPDSSYELRPFSGAVNKNGRGKLSQAARSLGAKAAVNASYFDSDGWIIGNLKYREQWYGMDEQPRSALVINNGAAGIVRDLAYAGTVTIAKLGVTQPVTGLNRRRQSDDLIVYTPQFGANTQTNAFGCEVKLDKKGRVLAVSKAGNMSIEKDTVVLSAHGNAAKVLEQVRKGYRISLQQSFGNSFADEAELVVGAGPLLVDNGKPNVRIREEAIAPDIAYGRAPRTAVAIKKDGTLMLITVDGRSSNSAGLTLQDLAAYLVKLGARQALNFDGGGSSEMVLDGKVLNSPSDGRERAVSVGLGIFKR